MQTWNNFLGDQTWERVLGMDEVGRGPLAGPVCVAGVILPKKHGIKGLQDSKLLNERKRVELYDQIIELSHSQKGRKAEVYVEMESNRRIDKDGIAVCIKRMMLKIAKQAQPDFILADAMTVNLRDVPQIAVTKGDMKVDCIAAASIIAKVTRDRLMMEYDQKYLGYGLAGHKGYGTKVHREAILSLGLSALHRKSFCRGLE